MAVKKKVKKGSQTAFMDETPDTAIVPARDYEAKVDSMEVTETKGDRRKMVVAGIEIVSPKKFAGIVLQDYFPLGTEEDPDARQKATWKKFGAQRLKRLLKCAKVNTSNPDLDDMVSKAEGVDVTVIVTKIPATNADGETIEGEYRNRIQTYYAAGEGPDDEESDEDDEPAPKAKAAKKTASKKKPPVEEDDDDEEDEDDEDEEDDEEEDEPAPKAKKAPAKKAPAKKAVVDDDDDEDDDEEEEEEEDDESEEDDDEEDESDDDDDDDDEDDDEPPSRKGKAGRR